jgi:hypothetical protein
MRSLGGPLWLQQIAAAMTRHPLEQWLIVALALAMGLGGAVIMRRKGRSGLSGFVLGLLLGPIGLVVTKAMRADGAASSPRR